MQGHQTNSRRRLEWEERWRKRSSAKLLSWVSARSAKVRWQSSLCRCRLSGGKFGRKLIFIPKGQFVDSYDPTIEETFNKNIKIRNQVIFAQIEGNLRIRESLKPHKSFLLYSWGRKAIISDQVWLLKTKLQLNLQFKWYTANLKRQNPSKLQNQLLALFDNIVPQGLWVARGGHSRPGWVQHLSNTVRSRHPRVIIFTFAFKFVFVLVVQIQKPSYTVHSGHPRVIIYLHLYLLLYFHLFIFICIWYLSVASCRHSMPSTFMGEMEWSLNLATITYFVISDTS